MLWEEKNPNFFTNWDFFAFLMLNICSCISGKDNDDELGNDIKDNAMDDESKEEAALELVVIVILCYIVCLILMWVVNFKMQKDIDIIGDILMLIFFFRNLSPNALFV